MTTPRFIPVDRRKAAEIKSLPPKSWGARRELSPVTLKLLDGEMLFTTDKKWKPSAKTLERRGMKIHRRTDDGGVYYWATDA